MKTKEACEYTFVNYPEQRTREDYVNAIRKIVELHKGMEEVIALYRFGSISALGISDIDYFIVTKGEDMNFRYKCPHDKFSEKEKYLFQHYPSAIVPQKLLPQLHLLAPFFEIECIYQREGYALDLPNIKISKEEAEMFIADIIFMAYPRIFICAVEKRTIDVRAALTIIYALKYPILLFKIMGVKQRNWEQYKKRVENLRKDWFKNKKQENELIALLKEAISIAMDMIEAYKQYCHKKSVGGNKQKMWKSRTISACFEEEYDKENALCKMRLSYAKDKAFTSILPEAINAHLEQYAGQNNLFGTYVNKYVGLKQRQNTCSEGIKRRTEAMSVLLNYTTKIKYRRGAFSPFNVGYLDHVGFPNKVRDVLWCLKLRTK